MHDMGQRQRQLNAYVRVYVNETNVYVYVCVHLLYTKTVCWCVWLVINLMAMSLRLTISCNSCWPYICTYIVIYISMYFKCLYVCMYCDTCIYVYTYARVYVFLYKQMYFCMCWLYPCMYVCMYVIATRHQQTYSWRQHTQTNTNICMYICIYLYARAYTAYDRWAGRIHTNYICMYILLFCLGSNNKSAATLLGFTLIADM